MSKLYRARSLLYRRQILQVNIRWKALDEIYKIYMLLHRSDLNISEHFRHLCTVFHSTRNPIILKRYAVKLRMMQEHDKSPQLNFTRMIQ